MNSRQVLEHSHQALLAALDGIPGQDAEGHLVDGKWTVKETIAQLAAWEHLLEEVIATQMTTVGEEGTPHLDLFRDAPLDEFNQFYVDNRKTAPYSEVLSELNSSHDHLMKSFYLLAQAPKMLSSTGTLPWMGREFSLEKFIVEVVCQHKLHHAELIDKFKRHMLRLEQQPSKPADD